VGKEGKGIFSARENKGTHRLNGTSLRDHSKRIGERGMDGEEIRQQVSRGMRRSGFVDGREFSLAAAV
jgi:hypothetical protein